MIRFKQSGANLKRKLFILLLVPIFAYCGIAIFGVVFPAPYGRCDFYNQELSGGVRVYQGKKLELNICGLGGDKLQNDDQVRLQVFNEKGDLLATRYFVIDWNTRFPRVLEHHSDHVVYFDASKEDGFKQTLSMPPTILDWLRARIPTTLEGRLPIDRFR